MGYLTTKGVSLALASGLVIGLWKSQFTPLYKVLKTLPQYATEDLVRGAAVWGLLAVGATGPGIQYGVVEVVALSWSWSIAASRAGRDPRATIFRAVLVAAVAGCYLMGWTLTWWLVLIYGTIASCLRRIGIPPMPILVGHTVVEEHLSDRAAQLAWDNRPPKWERVPITTQDGIQLMAASYTIDPKLKRWVVFMNGNAMLVEHSLSQHQTLANALGLNLISYNYRGCGLSQGCPRVASDLVNDGAAVLDHLVAMGVPSSEILVFGMSLGGAIGAYVRALPRFQDGPIVLERSFCDVFDAALTIGTQLIDNEIPAAQRPSDNSVAQTLLYWVGMALVLPMLNLTGWHLTPDAALHAVKGKVLLTHHPKDGVLTVGCQSHQGSFKSADVVQLTTEFRSDAGVSPLYHQFPVTSDPRWPTISQKIKALF